MIICRSRRGGLLDEDGARRFRDSRSKSPSSRFDHPRSPPPSASSNTGSGRFEQSSSSIASTSEVPRQPLSWGSGYSSPSRRAQGGSFNNDDVRSPSPVAQYYEDM